MSSTAKGRLPSKPLSYKFKDLCTKEEIMVDYITGRLYVRLTSGEIVDITSIVLEDIRNFRTMDEYIYVHVPNSNGIVTIKAAYVDIIERIINTNQAIADLQDPSLEDSLYSILTRNYINADTELFNQITNNYTEADSILKAYVNNLFAELGLVYHEEDDTYTIAIPNAYIVHDGVSEIYNIPIKLEPPNNSNGITMQNSTSFYIYTVPVTQEKEFKITLDPNTDKIMSKELFIKNTSNETSALNYAINKIETNQSLLMEYESISYAIIGVGRLSIFTDYPITQAIYINFVISRD